MKFNLLRILKRFKNKLFFKFKREISENSKDIYAIVLLAIEHSTNEGNKIICGPNGGDIIIKLADLGYHVIITSRDVIITNHDFPSLGNIESDVIHRILFKANEKISGLIQDEKNDILENHRLLLSKVKTKIRINERIARLHENNKQK